MKQYRELCNRILTEGSPKTDRTGTGTLSVFGHQMRFDLQKGFPLVTLKRTHFRSIAAELLWFLSGDTNVKKLQEMGCTIWDEWADADGNLGPVYGHQFRHFGGKPNCRFQPEPILRNGIEKTYLGVANGSGSTKSTLGKTWEGMIARCYDKKSVSYPNYGGKGVFVHNDWLEFSAFERDAVNLPGFGRLTEKNERLVLDKDSIGSGFEYGPNSCIWITDAENLRLNKTQIYTVEKDGIKYEFTSISDFCASQGFDGSNFSDLWTGNKNAKVRNGFTFVGMRHANPGVDQITSVIESIRTNPDSRRHIVSAWNPGDIPGMALAPCHVMFQFYVNDGRLSCHVYQRSADVFLGVPFNIASYALLTHMVAQQCNLGVGDLVWTGGDCHLYANHLMQTHTMLRRQEKGLAEILLYHRPSIFEYQLSDILLTHYNAHDAIKAPVAV